MIKSLIGKNNLLLKPNIIWEIDIVYFPKHNNINNLKINVFFVVVDSFSKYCIYGTNVTSNQTAQYFKEIIFNLLEKSINKSLIIHSDNGTQFSSNLWYEFSLFLNNWYNTKLLVSNTKAYNTYAINFLLGCAGKTF